jgi:hypothetical protein
MSDGFIQLPSDGGGKSVDAAAVTIPAGTIVIGSDGTQTTLTADAVYYRQIVVLGDLESAGKWAVIDGETGRGTLHVNNGDLLPVLQQIAESLNEIKLLLLQAIQ